MLLAIPISACGPSETRPASVENLKCRGSATDFFKLKDKKLQDEFFFKIDSFPKNKEDKEIFVDLTTEYLNKFLSDINVDSLTANSIFEKEYHLNRAPKGFKDPEYAKTKLK